VAKTHGNCLYKAKNILAEKVLSKQIVKHQIVFLTFVIAQPAPKNATDHVYKVLNNQFNWLFLHDSYKNASFI